MNNYVRRLLRPVFKHIPKARTAFEVAVGNPPHGLKLLINSQIDSQVDHHPDVYPFAAYLAQMFSCTHVIIAGPPTPRKLVHLFPKFKIIGVVEPANLNTYRRRFPFVNWVVGDPGRLDSISIPESILRRALIVCETLTSEMQSYLLANLKRLLDCAPVCLLTSARRHFEEQSTDLDELSPEKLEQLINAAGLNPSFVGLTASDNVDYEKTTALAILSNNAADRSLEVRAPANFRVIAFMAAFNEEDIIVESIKKWTNQGVSVHVLENWSTDSTYQLLKQLESELPVTVERFPQAGPSPYFEWQRMLERIEALSGELKADWFVRRGADELLGSPWPQVSYRDALYLVDRAGFNCVDHTILNFYPVGNGFQSGMDHESYFKHFEFDRVPEHFQRKAWKNSPAPISTTRSGGHDVRFEGRRIYPFKFLLKHYPYRSQEHGERKVFRERKLRWNPAERAKGWHVQYDGIEKGHQFLQSPLEKELYDEERFNQDYLIERLSGIGIDHG